MNDAANKILATALSDCLPRRPRLAILTGAGCSTASGIPDYRDHNGDWKRAQPMHLPDFLANPHARQRYWARSMAGFRSFSRAMPNDVHKMLCTMEATGLNHHVITQNVDSLHQRAGSRRVVDLHGRLDKVICLDCGTPSSRTNLQLELEQRNPDWAYEVAKIAPDGDVDLNQVDYTQFEVVTCKQCDGILKPDVVFFGENVPRSRVDFAMARLHEADALLVVGSSLMVFSGFRFARAAQAAGKPVLIFNKGRTRADDIATLKWEGDVAKSLQTLLAWHKSAH